MASDVTTSPGPPPIDSRFKLATDSMLFFEFSLWSCFTDDAILSLLVYAANGLFDLSTLLNLLSIEAPPSRDFFLVSALPDWSRHRSLMNMNL